MKIEVIEISAYTKKEAIELAASKGFVMENKFNSTIAYKEAIVNADFDINKFAEEQIEKKARGAVNLGFIVIVEPGIPETKTRVWEVNTELPVYEQYHLHYMLVSVKDNRILGYEQYKHDAFKLAKTLMPEVKSKINIEKVKLPASGNVAGWLDYKPSENIALGRYILFGKTN